MLPPKLFTQLFLLTFCLFASAELMANTKVEQETEKLKALQAQIKKQRQQLEKQLNEQSSLETRFKAAELKVADIALSIKSTQQQLSQVNGKISSLQTEQKELETKKKQQQGVLAEMIKNAYLNGKHDYTKLLLNQEEPSQLERLLTYYRKLQDSRVKQLEEIQQVMTRLVEVAQELTQQQSELTRLKEQQTEDRKQLVASQTERKAALNKLKRAIKSDKNKLEQLELDEQRLTQAIAKARENVTRDPESLAGLYNLKKKLSWPTRGRLKHKFGQRRQGDLRWKGVMIKGGLGNPVNAIADGIVVYSDWLKGFGWVTAVDHGKGYMSLYSHNQALLKQLGDFVQQDEPLALVGQSGGLNEPSLYFEIRYKGKTVNPARWCR